MTTRIETLNSTYEIDYEGKRVRRTGGAEDDNSRWPQGLFVWREYSDLQNMFGRIYVCWPDNQATITSEIVAAEEVSR